MARTALTVQTVALAGTTVTYSAANVDGHSIPAGDVGNVYLEVRNAAGSPINVTIPATGRMQGQLVTDLVVAVPATTGVKHITGLSAAAFGQTDGTVSINFSAVTSVTVAAFKKA